MVRPNGMLHLEEAAEYPSLDREHRQPALLPLCAGKGQRLLSEAWNDCRRTRRWVPRLMNHVTVGFTKLHPSAVVPEPAHGYQEDAGADLRSVEDWYINPGTREIVSTGISIQLKPGLEAQIRSRSGLSAKHGICVLNSPGTIDPSYRGELKVILHNAGKEPFRVSVGDRIAQLVVAPYFGVNWVEAKPEASNRGTSGLGSTGVK